MGWIDALKQWLNIKEPEETPEEIQKAEELRNEFKERYHHFKVLLAANQKSLEGMADIEQALAGCNPFSMTFVRSRCTDVAVNVLRMIRNLEHLAPEKYELLSPVFFQIRKSVDDILMEKRPLLPREIVIGLKNPNQEAFNQVNSTPFISNQPVIKQADSNESIKQKSIIIPSSDLVGSKMASLAEIGRCCNVNIPRGFVITSYAYDLFVHADAFETEAGSGGGLQTEIDRLIQTCDSDDIEAMHAMSAKIRQMIIKATIPEQVVQAIESAWKNLESEYTNQLMYNASSSSHGINANHNNHNSSLRVALRSSALGEDSKNSSFAGQYHSELNVSKDSIFEAYKTVVASKYTLHAMMYRINKGFRDEDVPMAVGCVQMVDAASGGVMYSGNPVDSGDNSIFISAVFGLPKAVVDGSVTSDLFVVSRSDLSIVREEIGIKDKKFVCYPEEGVCRMEISTEERQKPAISTQQVIELANTALKLEAHFGTPQDIEWAIDSHGELLILQSRPLQQNSPYEQNKSDINLTTSNNILNEANVCFEEDVIAKGGVSAAPGIASGEAFVALKNVDILRFPTGGILVIRQALPEWATVVARASAMLSEQGSAASHLASVAREFKVPSIFGLQGITSKIKSGDTISINADSQIVLKGNVDFKDVEENKNEIEKINPMKGSPVYNILQRCSRHIIPLNLLEPDSHDFKPQNCKTFHDITRFIHEKSVSEMFSFGKNHDFPEKSSKQLHYKVPMQWYILDLDDGFSVPIKGKYVKLEEIASIPMLAFWDGFVAIPWDGPPAIDGRGMMSVMFQSTANTALTTGVQSAYAQHNYFMISKNYCSLNSRLGYHFSTMEALVSERISENYITFQFKGGAADKQRRLNRVHFIGNILEDYGFRSIIREDHLNAKIQGYDENFMKSRLKILGHLTLHTRQLDMIMTNPAQVAFYGNKLRKEIDSFELCYSS
ncbi:MAG: pyruvate, water dikinase [Desulfamplus sp.]|nr:pyruvate, water dikinase [Desulfamplus sp.]